MKLLSVVFAVCCISAAYADDSNSEGLKEICCKTATPYLEAKKKPGTFFACIIHELVLQFHDKHCEPKLSKGILCCFVKDNNNVNNGGNDGVNNGDNNVPTDDGNKANNDVGNEDANNNNKDDIGNNGEENNNDGSAVDIEGEAGQDVGIDPEDDKQTNNEKPIEEGNTKSRQHAVKAKHHASKSKLQKKNKDNKKQKGASSKKKTHSKNKNHNNKGRTIKLSHKEKA